MQLRTDYTLGDIPFSEYPRPQLKRESFLNLNGKWRFGKASKDDISATADREILVPFSPETAASGLTGDFELSDFEKLIYEREVVLGSDMLKGVTLIHFGAVDQECDVFWNGSLVGHHRGGFTPFTIDVTAVAVKGENILRVECIDSTEKSEGARGKQSSNRGQYWYTKQSGIWQTVWMESAPADHIKSLRITPDYFKSEVTVESDCEAKQTITVFDGGDVIIEEKFEKKITLKYSFDAWSPEDPKLYTFKIVTDSGDEIKSYFGVRSFGVARDSRGKQRLTLNGKPYFFNGVLDQGYWPEGLLTPPSNEAMFEELKMLKKMGFNMVRKHIKLEPMLWYYYCDVLGLTVWQDFVNGGGEYKFLHVAALPFLGFHHKDNDYKFFARESKEGRAEFINAVYETVSALYNVPSIAVWVPFNEGWGQFDSKEITDLVKSLDSTRIIDSVSGWHDQGVGKTELLSLHTYYTKLKVPKDRRPVVLSEFGGYSLKVDGHVFCDKEFGYKTFKTKEDLQSAVEILYLKKLKPLIKKGLCGAVYTQVSDVEEEINGLVTYDRKVQKVDTEFMKRINSEIDSEANSIE
ncbi:MAG: glycoside hydrolase family 2 [Ruminococcaceae bacterium]|nr:glycoside hydrolase family 2 [Oscillospiraceae bacterium]